MERPRPLPHAARSLGQEHPLVAAQGAREPDRRAARDALGSPASQPAPLPRLPAARGTQTALPPRRPGARAGAPRGLAGLGDTLAAEAVRPPSSDAARTPRRHPRRHPPRPQQRPVGGPELQDPPHQPPRVRLPLRRPTDRPRLPDLRRHHDRPPAMNFTPNPDEAPHLRPAAPMVPAPVASATA